MATPDRSIIVTVLTTHMPRNDAAAALADVIDIHQPAGLGIVPIAEMEEHQRGILIGFAGNLHGLFGECISRSMHLVVPHVRRALTLGKITVILGIVNGFLRLGARETAHGLHVFP
jgi:hypothetical protein